MNIWLAVAFWLTSYHHVVVVLALVDRVVANFVHAGRVDKRTKRKHTVKRK